MAGRPMKDIPDDAPPAIKEFIGELRAFVRDAVGEEGSVTGLAERGPLSRSTFMGAISGQRMPTLSTVLGIVDTVAKHKVLPEREHRHLMSEWTERFDWATRALRVEPEPATATADGYHASTDMTYQWTVNSAVDRLMALSKKLNGAHPQGYMGAMNSYLKDHPQAAADLATVARAVEDGIDFPPKVALILGLLAVAEQGGHSPLTVEAVARRNAIVHGLDPTGRQSAVAKASAVLDDALQRLDEAHEAVRRARALVSLVAGADSDGLSDFDWLTGQEEGLILSDTQRPSPFPHPTGPPEPTSPVAQQLEGLTAEEQKDLLRDMLLHHAAGLLGDAEAEVLRELGEFFAVGFDSVTAVELRDRISAAIGLELPASLLVDHPTVSGLAEYVRELLAVPTAPKRTDAVPGEATGSAPAGVTRGAGTGT